MSRATSTTTKQVNVAQLSSELGSPVGGPDPSVWYTAASKTIWAEGVTQVALDLAITAHVANQAWGFVPDPTLTPPGVMLPYSGSSDPPGWLICDGRSVLRSSYPFLFAAVGTMFGFLDATHFNIPDARGRMPLGADATHALGTTGGSLDHTHPGPPVHVVTQPSAHPNHVVIQPAAHANHVVTQPGAHSNHVVTQPGAHPNHVLTQPNAHADVLNHVHVQNAQGGTTPSTTGTHLVTSAATGGSLRASAQSTANPTAGGVASQAHSGAAVDAHSVHAGGAVDAHSAHAGAAVDAHSAHAGTAVDAHSAHAGTAVDAHGVTGTANPPYLAVNWIVKY